MFAALLIGSNPPPPKSLSIDLLYLRARGYSSYRGGLFRQAISIYEGVFEQAGRERDLDSQITALLNIAGMHYALFEYQKAIDVYLRAHRLAKQTERQIFISVIDTNLTSLYITVGDFDAADQSSQEGLANTNQSFRYTLLASRATLCLNQQKTGEAITLLKEAIFEADLNGDLNAIAHYYDLIAEEAMLHQHNLALAERAQTEAFRIRSFSHDRDLRISFLQLSRLRLYQRDVKSANILIAKATSMPDRSLGNPTWFTNQLEAEILAKSGDHRAALRRYVEAMKEARQWQAEAAPVGILGSGARRWIDDLYAEVVSASLASDPRGVDGFEATEEDRAAALRQSLNATRALLRKAPPEYWSTLAQLRSAESDNFGREDQDSLDKVKLLKRQLSELEVQAGLNGFPGLSPEYFLERNTSVRALRRIQEGIKEDEALLSFHLGTNNTTALWTVTHSDIKLIRLPQEQLRRLIREFRIAVEHGSNTRDSLGESLYDKLFGKVSREVQQKRIWIISAEDAFFEVPFPALSTGKSGGNLVYLIEKHAIMYTPSAAMLSPSPAQPVKGPFVGVGDGIYNPADERRRKPLLAGWPFIRLNAKPGPPLPRLFGSAEELKTCARAWNAPSVLLTGEQASRAQFEAALLKRPAVIHFAAHFLTAPNNPDEAVIDLGLTPEGQADLLDEKQIASLNVPDATVVMSGCNSANSRSIPTAGALGLTRAWLIAGARTVIGSRWLTPDDTGVLFQFFYQEFSKRQEDPAPVRAAALSLRSAQIAMLRSNTWRADPKYWSAFYMLGKE